MSGAGTSETSGMPRYTSSPRPAPVVGTPNAWQQHVVDLVESSVPGAVERVVVDRGELTLHLDRDQLVAVSRLLRDHPELRFELLSSLSGVDYLGLDQLDPSGRRLHSVCHLTSLSYVRRIRVEVSVSVEDPHVPSLVPVWPTADWHEREAWDFFGIVYDGHPGLTRIQMPDDWEGHPQRKDYPLGGVPVEYHGAQVPPPDERRAWA